MPKYVDGFVFAISVDRVEEYKRMAQKAGAVWKEHGALSYFECIGDDLDSGPGMGMVSFKSAAGAKEGETVVFSWIVFESREHREMVNAAVMDDSRMKDMMESDTGPFDYKRMAYGGFKTLVEL